MTLELIKQMIQNMEINEAKLALFYLCKVLEDEQIPNDDPLLDKIVTLITVLNSPLFKLKQGNFELSELHNILSSIKEAHQQLYDLIEVGHYSKKAKQTILQVCGLIAAFLFMIPMGLMSTLMCLVCVDKRNLNTITEIVKYFLTGLLISACICFRFFESFENQKDRQLRSVMHDLSHSFSSYQTNLEELNFLENKKQTLLTELFGEDDEAKTSFLAAEQSYHLVGFQAQFLSYNLKGYVGHHSCLYFKIKDREIILETGPSSTVEISEAFEKRLKFPEDEQLDQIYDRKCAGETLLNMYAMHQLLQKRYNIELKNMPHLISVYKPGDHDCHTYIDKILASVSEPLSDVQRTFHLDAQVGQRMCHLLSKYGTFQEKPVIDKKIVLPTSCMDPALVVKG